MNLLLETNILLYTYLFIYNISILFIFWLLFSTLILGVNTLNSFNSLSFSSYLVLTLTLLILSVAGIPPFIGFFSNLFIFLVVTNYAFNLLYPLLFIVVFAGLYFYIQNIRFIHSTNLHSSSTPHLLNERQSVIFLYSTSLVLIFIVFGFFYIDDILLLWAWVLL